MTLKEFLDEWNNDSPCLLVHTSGSTGKPKPIMVDKQRMEASARITCDFLGLKSGDTALLCMPLDYIAGKMVVVRSLVRNLRLIDVQPSGHPLQGMQEAPVFAAMIPMQVYNSLQIAEERDTLLRIKHLIIGGGAIDKALAEELQAFPNSVWSTYGMTETLSHIALRRLNGEKTDEWYTPFDSVNVSLSPEGCLAIDAPLVCDKHLITNDMAEIAADGRRFRILGRKDNMIDTGGIKISMEEIENRLNGHLPFPYMVTKKDDAKFGEIIVLLVQSKDIAFVSKQCEEHLPKYYRPRFYVSVNKLPQTETGKPARAEALRIAADASYSIE